MTSTSQNDIDRQLSLAMQWHQQGKLREALQAYESILATQADHAEALHRLGILHHQTGRHAQAAELIRRAILKTPEAAAYHSNLGLALRGAKEPAQAVAAFDEAIRIKPDFAGAHFNRALALQELNQLDQAIDSFQKALSLRPDLAEAHVRMGDLYALQGKGEEAQAQYQRAAQLKPNLPGLQAKIQGDPVTKSASAPPSPPKPSITSFAVTAPKVSFSPTWGSVKISTPFSAPAAPPRPSVSYDALLQNGNSHFAQQRYEEAIRAYSEALKLQPQSVEAAFNQANAWLQLGRLTEAESGFHKAIQLQPGLSLAHYQLGVIYQQQERNDEAVRCYASAVQFNPSFAQAHFNAGTVLEKLGLFERALASFQAACQADPMLPEPFINQANILVKLKRLVEAIATYQRVLELKPDHVDALTNIGTAHVQMKNPALALEAYTAALQIRPDDAGLHAKRAVVHADMKKLDLAQQDFARAISLDPTLELLLGNALSNQMTMCDWSGLCEHQSRIWQSVMVDGLNCIQPFNALGLFDQPDLHLRIAQMHAQQHPAVPLETPFQCSGGEKIKVAYISADFHNHATAFLMAELFESHNRTDFETIAISIGPDANDEMRKRLHKAFDRFVDAREMSDSAVARLCRELGVDIAVDLKGYTADARFGIFAHRCAPTQVSYIGYPGTTGVDYMDYVIADPVVVPFDQQPFYTEKIVHLPHSYQVNDAHRRISERTFTRAELGLPESGFVFCCFNNNYKIHPSTFDIWMRLLNATPGSVFWLFEDNSFVAANLRREASARGVDASRLVFAKRMPLDEHLARHRQADLFLDTLPYNAHTTTSDALWAGLPVVTLKGQAFAGRVAASLLTAVGLPELITETPEAYEALALHLAHHRNELSAIRSRLAEQRLTQPLFNAPLFARHLEAAYRTMAQRQRDGLAPQAFAIPA